MPRSQEGVQALRRDPNTLLASVTRRNTPDKHEDEARNQENSAEKLAAGESEQTVHDDTPGNHKDEARSQENSAEKLAETTTLTQERMKRDPHLLANQSKLKPRR